MIFAKSIHKLAMTFEPMRSQTQNCYISFLFVEYYRKMQRWFDKEKLMPQNEV